MKNTGSAAHPKMSGPRRKQLSEIPVERFAKIIAEMRAVHPREEVSKERVRMYYELLKNIPWRALREAVYRCLVEIPYFPLPYDIVQRVRLPPSRPTPEPGTQFDPRVKDLLGDLAHSYEPAPKAPEEQQAKRAELKRQQGILRRKSGDGKDEPQDGEN